MSGNKTEKRKRGNEKEKKDYKIETSRPETVHHTISFERISEMKTKFNKFTGSARSKGSQNTHAKSSKTSIRTEK